MFWLLKHRIYHSWWFSSGSNVLLFELICSDNLSDSSPLCYKTFRKESFYFDRNIWKVYCNWNLLQSPPRRHDLVFKEKNGYQNFLVGNTEEILQKLVSLCFEYCYEDCIYTLFEFEFIRKMAAKMQMSSTIFKGQHFSTNKTKERTDCPAWQKNSRQ